MKGVSPEMAAQAAVLLEADRQGAPTVLPSTSMSQLGSGSCRKVPATVAQDAAAVAAEVGEGRRA